MNRLKLWLYALLVIGAAGLSLLVVFTLQRIVVAPLGGEPAYVVEVARRVAEGDVAFEIRSTPACTSVGPA